MILNHEKLQRIKCNSRIQMLLCTSFLFVLVLLFSLNALTWEDLASFWRYSFSICFSLLLAWKTYAREHIHSDLWAWCLFPMPVTSSWDGCPLPRPLGAAENHRVCLWSKANYSSLKKQKAKAKKKKDLSCQLLGKHRLLWREREREKRQK